MVEDTEFVIPIHPELLDISCGEASNEPPGSHIPLQHVHQGFLLQANVNETRICENIKLERRQVGWTLLPNASIHRTLIRNCDDTQASQLPSHDVKSLTISNLKQNKFNLIEDIFDDSTLLLRKVTWSTRFASQEEAENWYNILQLIHRSFQPSPVRLPPPVVAPPRVRSLLELLPLPRVSASLPCGTASPRPFPTRRTVVLRGTVERKHSHRFRDRTWRKWVPVTWVAYSDGTLEEYAKSKHNHELLSAYRLSDCSIRSVPLPYQTPSVFVNPDNYLCISNHNLALELYKKLTGRVDLYRTPNKLLQIQWLAVLTNLSFSTSPRRTTPVMIKATASEPTRFPAKVSILKEKRYTRLL
ncbi:uncharacterized protein LOC129598234 isoform X2 [Paramacrobiotus metropolitanus]|uniref:uncharacterized protein LOC129598234 isoform X2 n=1 Tax=Paramacrobiotus metropolitanus TaxID=2943436 RepID=UPI002445D6F0|nr:uncharacterized protein LOC129598234 isoform X2 [Paramacrobiotus metropolitanus]